MPLKRASRAAVLRAFVNSRADSPSISLSRAISRSRSRTSASVCVNSLYGVPHQIVDGAVLMEQPRHLVRMTDEIRRELRRDHGVDALAVRLGQIDEPPRGRLREQLLLRVPLERNRHPLGAIAVPAQFVDQPANVQLGAAVNEGDLASQTRTLVRRYLDVKFRHAVDSPRHHESSLITRYPMTRLSCREPEVDDVAVLDDVFLAFEAHFAVIAARRHRAARDQVVVADDLRADEASRDVAVDLAGGELRGVFRAESTMRGTRLRRP